jgi:hypothetical protein
MSLPAALLAIGKGVAAFAAKNPAVVNQALNTGATLLTNRRNRQTSLDFYDRQRVDALADWNRQNIYNSPKAQMERFKEAGLNPHLIYGQTNTAQPIRSVDMKAPTTEAPQLNPFAQQQLLNMKIQNSLLAEQVKGAKIKNDVDETSMYYDMEQRYQRGLLTGYQAQDTMFNRYRKEQMLKPEINKILADTNLSTARKAQANQIITNLVTTERLLQKKIVTEDFVQQAYTGRIGLTSAQTSYTDTQKNVATKVLELKQMGLTLDTIKDLFGLLTPTKSKLPK